MIDLQAIVTQDEFGNLVGISQPAVSGLMSRGVLREGGSAREWLLAYCGHLRETAAGRLASGGLDLATERAALAKAQRERIEMANAVTRREMAPVWVIAEVLARVGRQIASILEALPPAIKRRALSLTPDDLLEIEKEIVRARNLAASIKLDLSDIPGCDEGSPEEQASDEAPQDSR